MKLTEKQRRFADYYIETGNATEAYKKAYNSKNDNTAAKEGHKLLKNPKVTQEIESRIAEKESELIAKQDEVLKYLTKVMRREEMEHTVVTLKTSRSWYDDNGKKNTVEEEKVEIVPIPSRLSDSNKAAELLGKRYVLWTDKQQIEGNTTINVSLSDEE